MIKLKNLLEAVLKRNNKFIVYHGTDKKFRKFSIEKSTMGNIWFTSDKESIIKRYVGANGYGYIITAEVIINNPAGWDEYEKWSLGELKRYGYDGAILAKGNNQFDCFVFDPNHIKIIKFEKVI